MNKCIFCKCVHGESYRVFDLGINYCMKCGFSFPLPGRTFVGVYAGKFNNQHRFILSRESVTKCPSCGDSIEKINFACGGSFYFNSSEVQNEQLPEFTKI